MSHCRCSHGILIINTFSILVSRFFCNYPHAISSFCILWNVPKYEISCIQSYKRIIYYYNITLFLLLFFIAIKILER